MKFFRKKVAPFGLLISALVAISAQAVTEETLAQSGEDNIEMIQASPAVVSVDSLDVSVAAMDAAIAELERAIAPEPVTARVAPELPPMLYLNSDAETSEILTRWAEQYDYVVKWNTEKTVNFANGMTYSGEFRTVLTNLANDIANMGIDLNFKVFEKNKVIVVYSVR